MGRAPVAPGLGISAESRWGVRSRPARRRIRYRCQGSREDKREGDGEASCEDATLIDARHGETFWRAHDWRLALCWVAIQLLSPITSESIRRCRSGEMAPRRGSGFGG